MSPTTHAGLQPGAWYVAHGQMHYIHSRVVKGQNLNLDTKITLPDELLRMCSLQCELLAPGRGSCPRCATGPKGGFKITFSGSEAPMVSYVITSVTYNIHEANLWRNGTRQYTSRSVNRVIPLDIQEECRWNSGESAANKEVLLTDIADGVVGALKMPQASKAMSAAAQANLTQAVSLHQRLLRELIPQELKGATVQHDMVQSFSNKANFLARIGGHSTYQQFGPAELAYINSLILKAGMQKNPKLVESILETYKKMETAKALEEVPVYDPAYIREWLTKGTRKAVAA